MAKKQTKKSKGTKKEKVNEFFNVVPRGVIENVKRELGDRYPIFSTTQGIEDRLVAPINLLDTSIFPISLVRILELVGEIDNGTFALTPNVIIRNGVVYNTRMGKHKLNLKDYCSQLSHNAVNGVTAVRCRKVSTKLFEKCISQFDGDYEKILHVTSITMDLFCSSILDACFRTMSSVVYTFMYARKNDYQLINDMPSMWRNCRTLDEFIDVNEAIKVNLSKDRKEKEFFKDVSYELLHFVAKEWMNTFDADAYQKAVEEFGVEADWKHIDICGILPEVLKITKNFYRYWNKNYRYDGLAPEIEVNGPFDQYSDFSPTFELVSTFLLDNDATEINDSLFKLSWNAEIQHTLKNSKSNLSIRFLSEKYKKSILSYEDTSDIGEVIKNWGIPGLIKCVFPVKINTSITKSVLLADNFEFEIIYKGNADRLNDYVFDKNDKLIHDMNPELYNEMYDYIRTKGNALIVRHRGHMLITNGDRVVQTRYAESSFDEAISTVQESRKILDCIYNAYVYLRSKEKDGGIDFYFEENEEVIHQSSNKHQIIQRRGSFVRGHFRHYKSGIVTLVRPHVRKGTNYIGEYVLEL